MKQNIKILIAGVAIIIVTNVVALGGVAYNRSGEPNSVIELTERELSIPYDFFQDRENTGLGLDLECRNCWGNPDWFDRDKLIELGFDPDAYPDDNGAYSWRYDKNLSRAVHLVLEYDGEAHRRLVSDAQEKLVSEQAKLAKKPDDEDVKTWVEYAERELNNEQRRYSRLFAIDAGADRAALREAYPDNGKYIIVQAQVAQDWGYDENEKKIWKGRIEGLLIESINVPLQHRSVFDTQEQTDSSNDNDNWLPSYKVTIAFGKRLEPWVVDVEKL